MEREREWGLVDTNLLGFPGGSVVKNLSEMQEMQVQSLVWEKEMGATHSSILAWGIPRQRSLAGHSP